MHKKIELLPESAAKLTGAKTPGNFERSCYICRIHGDGTATIALDWYEMSDGRDYMSSDIFMRTEVNAAREIVKILNRHLPNRVNAAEEIDSPEGD